MKKRMRLKKKWFIINRNSKIIISFLLIFSCTLSISLLFKRGIDIVLKTIAENELKNISTYIINEGVESIIDEKLKVDEMYSMVTNSEGEIITVDFNTNKINSSLTEINKNVLTNLKKLERGEYNLLDNNIFKKEANNKGFIYYIPLGIITKNPVMADLGPKIPVKATLIGNVTSNIKTEIIPYGINNSLLKVYININANINFIMPFVSDKVIVENEIPLILKIINGKVPEVYGGNFSATSPITSLE